ncbi:hypothetical protein CYMTET_50718 [Cymbomonas tetramitiformis]|uniref:UspA domain-containing protein n=1 Tax=Cymbomonas tetramitiformis TaxID=36881 RepID=A0AAE0BNQ6_9CHLO|nr:hypothetical protein CYMTET_50718 [Cymbomonas tetramitiformis]
MSLDNFDLVDKYLCKGSGKQLLYGVGVDGSDLAKKCFEVAASLVNTEKGDRLYVLHITTLKDVSEAREPTNSSVRASILAAPDHLKSEYELLAHKLGMEIIWITETRLGEDKSISEKLCELVERLQLDFMVLGAYGTTDEGLEMREFLKNKFGAVSDESLRAANSSLIMVKSTSYDLESCRRWVLATDNSPAAQAAFALLIKRMVKKGDKVDVVYASEIVSHTTLLEGYKDEMAKAEIDGQIVFRRSHPGESLTDSLTNYCREVDADFLCIGASGYGEAKLGSDPREMEELRKMQH